MAKRVILLGKGDLAIRIAEWFHAQRDYQLDYVVPVVPEPTWTGSLMGWCQANGIAYVPSGCYQDVPGAGGESWHTDLALSVFYDRILRPWFIDKCDRILNVHNAPLPRYRGIAPINWALKNEESEHGVTIHDITPEIDAGPIVAQAHFPVCPETDEVIDVYKRALLHAYALFEQTMPILEMITPIPQDESQATYYNQADRERLGNRRSFTRALSAHPEPAAPTAHG